MTHHPTTISLLLLACGATAAWPQAPDPPKHIIVYSEPGRYAGHPANNGIHSWGNEIVVGFVLGYYKQGPEGPETDPDRPFAPRQARTLDGGETWTLETPSFLDAEGKQKTPTPCPGGIDFTHPNFALRFAKDEGREAFSYFYWSNDRCHTWNGPFQFPKFDRKGIYARTDYLVNGKHDLMAFLTSAKDEGREGRPFCARTTDGAKTWDFVSWIGDHPGPESYAIMPSTIRISDSELLTFVRCLRMESENRVRWLAPYRSTDNGKSWKLENENIIDGPGNPPAMIKLKDSRLALTYGYRLEPYGVRARISRDQGKTWSKEIMLRADGGAPDLGYPRTTQRPDGKIVTVYYFNDKSRQDRYIAATIWEPDND